MKNNAKFTVWFGSVVLLVVLSIATLFTFFGQLKDAAQMRQHTFINLNHAQQLMSSLKDAETGERGFLLTGDEAFLQPYLAVHDSIPGQLEELRQLTFIPAAQQHIIAITPLITAQLDEMGRLIALSRNSELTAVIADIRGTEGKRQMDSIRSHMDSLTQIEDAALKQYDVAFQSQMRHLFAIIIFASLFVLLFAFAFMYFINNNNQQQLKNIVHGETKRLLDTQEEMNQQLKQAYAIVKDREETLLEEGALQRAIFNSANFSSIATDARGVIQIFNVGAERMLGYTASEVMNKITPADISDPKEVIQRATTLSTELDTTITPGFEALVFKASRGIEDIYELTYIRKDGSRFPAVVSVTALRDANETIIGYLLIGTDNTARKQAEEALLKAGALQSAIFNSANFSSIATDAKGVIQIFNVGAERMLGYEAVEVMNKITPADISDPKEVILRATTLSTELETTITPGFEALVFKASRGIEDIYELTYIRKDGTRFPAVVSVTALRDAQNLIIGYLLIGTDNTARKQVEAEQKKLDQRLRDQQFYTRSLIESNIDALMTTDPAGIISDVNRQMEELTGCTRDELIGAPFKNYFTDPERAEAGIKRVLSENKVTNYELTARTRDGKETEVSYNATTFYDRDRVLQGVFAAARDITERKLLDRVLEENNVELEAAKSVAEKANLAKSDFLSSMSHELRTPLSAILGFAQLIDSGNPAPSPIQKRSLDQILQAGWYLLDLINEILDLALIESGKLSLSMEPVSLADVMHECETMIEPQAQKRGIKVSFPQFDILYSVFADHTRVKQVLINLLSNAIKYNKIDGTVVLTCQEHSPGRLRITVEDTGEGLSPDKIEQLFQPFNRLGQESNTEEGTGIGLVMTKRLIELMGGAIGLESTVGKGSTFWIEMNLTANNITVANESEPVFILQPQLQNDSIYTLLYVEDNPANLMLVEDLIARRPDIHLLTARDGHSGVALARGAQPNLILMDINLPGISGIEALKLLREDLMTAHIPVVALSANAIPRDIEKGLQAGFFRYLTKPIKVNEFMQTLDIALKLSDTTTPEPPLNAVGF